VKRHKRGRSGGTRDVLESGDFSDADVRHGPYYFCVEGYEEAIDGLLAQWEQAERSDYLSDALIFPLGFLGRHLVELRMKAAYEPLVGEPSPETHSLLELWTILRSAIEARRGPGANMSTRERYGHLPRETIQKLGITLSRRGELDRLATLVSALHEADPEGVAFRYPSAMPGHIKRIALDRLAGAAKELASYFDGVVTGFYEEDSLRAEMEAEFRSEMAAEWAEAARDAAPEDY